MLILLAGHRRRAPDRPHGGFGKAGGTVNVLAASGKSCGPGHPGFFDDVVWVVPLRTTADVGWLLSEVGLKRLPNATPEACPVGEPSARRWRQRWPGAGDAHRRRGHHHGWTQQAGRFAGRVGSDAAAPDRLAHITHHLSKPIPLTGSLWIRRIIPIWSTTAACTPALVIGGSAPARAPAPNWWRHYASGTWQRPRCAISTSLLSRETLIHGGNGQKSTRA